MTSATVVFADPLEEARYLDGAAREDAADPAIQAVASKIRREHRDGRALARAIFEYVRSHVRFFPDVHGEEFSSAAVTLRRGADDCDGSARLFVALCLAAGLEARMRAVLSADQQAVDHYQGIVDIEGAEVLAELTLACVELGDGAEAGQVDASGNFRLV